MRHVLRSSYAPSVPSTLQTVLAIVVAVLPGAIYLWGFEREAGKWAIGISDTLLRFVAASAIFQVLYAVPLYVLYERYVHHEVLRRGNVAAAGASTNTPGAAQA
jgi:uncharacterized protein DUF6338